jgi:membrane fusion protein
MAAEQQGGSAKGLFRKEALENLGTPRFGQVVLTRPLSYWWLTAGFALVTAAVVAFFFTFEYARKSVLPGEVVPDGGVLRVGAGVGGTLETVNVRPGDRVEIGTALAVVADGRETAGGVVAADKVSRLLEQRRASLADDENRIDQQAALRRDGVMRRVVSLKEEGRRLDEQIALQSKRVEIAQKSVADFASLQASNFVSPAQVRDKEADLLEQRSKLADLARAQSSGQREIVAAESELRDIEAQKGRDLEASRRSLSMLDQDLAEAQARRAVVVTSKARGTVAMVGVRPGQQVSAGQTLATIVPDGAELLVALYADSRSAGFVKQGMRVQLRYASFPYQKYGQFAGVVKEVSGTPARRGDFAGADSRADGAEVFRVMVALPKPTVTVHGREEALKPGSSVEASVILESRSLAEWAVEPIYSIKGRL